MSNTSSFCTRGHSSQTLGCRRALLKSRRKWGWNTFFFQSQHPVIVHTHKHTYCSGLLERRRADRREFPLHVRLRQLPAIILIHWSISLPVELCLCVCVRYRMSYVFSLFSLRLLSLNSKTWICLVSFRVTISHLGSKHLQEVGKPQVPRRRLNSCLVCVLWKHWYAPGCRFKTRENSDMTTASCRQNSHLPQWWREKKSSKIPNITFLYTNEHYFFKNWWCARINIPIKSLQPLLLCSL